MRNLIQVLPKSHSEAMTETHSFTEKFSKEFFMGSDHERYKTRQKQKFPSPQPQRCNLYEKLILNGFPNRAKRPDIHIF